MKCKHKFKYVGSTCATEDHWKCSSCGIIKGSKECWYEQFLDEMESALSTPSNTKRIQSLCRTCEVGYNCCPGYITGVLS